MMPSGPDGTTEARSTPRSLASLRTGGLASGRGRSAAVAGAETGADGAGAASGIVPCPFSSAWTAAETGADSWAGISADLRGRRLVEDVATP